MRRPLLIALLFIHLFSFSQNWVEMGDDVQLRISSNGIIAINQNDLSPASEFQNSGNHFLNQMGMWISARDESNALHTSIQMLNNKGEYDFSYGPLDTIVSQPDTSGWNKVWYINSSDVKYHQENYANVGYTVPESIANWPGENKSGDFVQYLAPFADINQNNTYDPENGDYPFIKGDEAVYVICNDNSFEHKVSGGLPLGLEVHLMIYKTSSAPNTYFMEYYLINRLDFDYHDIQIGMFLSGACGNEEDNYALTSISHNTIGIYNGDNYDEGGFGDQLPYVFCRFLNRELTGSIVFENTDNPINGIPQNALEYNYFLHSRWRNSDKIQFGNDGQTNSEDYPFMFAQDTDPQKNEWKEESVSEPGFRMILGRTSFNQLEEGGYLKLDFALGYGFYDSSEKVLPIIHDESEKSKTVFNAVTSVKPVLTDNVRIYPQPSSGIFNLGGLTAGNYKLFISDIQGNTLYEEDFFTIGTYQCNVLLPPGIYTIQLVNQGQMINKLLIIRP
ncbi:T9SS type A sorting domain-containing protein [bacterium]|nr:T9SS type A sorting domain-containing protein [bacterium]